MDIETLKKLDSDGLIGLETIYESQGNATAAAQVHSVLEKRGLHQTERLANSGKLYSHIVPVYADAEKTLLVRNMKQYVGDISEAFAPFLRQGVGCKLSQVKYDRAGNPVLASAVKTTDVFPGDVVVRG